MHMVRQCSPISSPGTTGVRVEIEATVAYSVLIAEPGIPSGAVLRVGQDVVVIHVPGMMDAAVELVLVDDPVAVRTPGDEHVASDGWTVPADDPPVKEPDFPRWRRIGLTRPVALQHLQKEPGAVCSGSFSYPAIRICSRKRADRIGAA